MSDADELKRKISKSLEDATLSIEKRIADALNQHGEFFGDLDEQDLDPIFRNLLYHLIDEQKLAGIDLPIQHNVIAMQIKMQDYAASVFCEVHIHQPIQAFLKFRYTLENDPRARNDKRLRLKGNNVELEEITRRFDIAAMTALRVMNVKRIAIHELADPSLLIKRTLPKQLKRLGFQGDVDLVELELTDERKLRVYIHTR